MNVVDLRNRFIAVNKQEPLDNLELLNFAKLSYVREDLTITQYRDLVKVLEVDKSYSPEGQVQEFTTFS
ncbi:YppF family protein [Bacillus sp. DJP31]|uniref:YppF family protein n=1 Tax=Bacillus sp. DJP31 TaxID=3409789 RepID=UPI003BB70BD1